MISIVRRIRPFLGRIIGVLVGVLAGPAGVFFGLLAGWMVDQYRSRSVSTMRVQRFLADPAAEPNAHRRGTYATAAIAVELLTNGSWPGEETISFLLRERWPRGRSGRNEHVLRRRIRPVGEDPVFRRHTLDICLLERHRIKLPLLLDTLPETLADGEGAYLVELLVRMLATRGRGVAAAERTVLVDLAEALKVGGSEVARLEGVYGTLSRRECEILGVAPDADLRAIKRSYRALAAQLHPDTGSHLDGEHREMMEVAFLRIHEAYRDLLRQLEEREAIQTR